MGQFRIPLPIRGGSSLGEPLANHGSTRVRPVKANACWRKLDAFPGTFLYGWCRSLSAVETFPKTIVPKFNQEGLSLINDCQEDRLWDGALPAYLEITEREGIGRSILHGWFGIIESDAALARARVLAASLALALSGLGGAKDVPVTTARKRGQTRERLGAPRVPSSGKLAAAIAPTRCVIQFDD